MDARVLRRLCRIQGGAYIAATTVAGCEFVALLCEVRMKVIDDRLVDIFRAARRRSYRLRGLEDACDIDVDSGSASRRAGDEWSASGGCCWLRGVLRLRLVKRAAWVSVTRPASS